MVRPVEHGVKVGVLPEVPESAFAPHRNLPAIKPQDHDTADGDHHIAASTRLEPPEIYHHVADAGAAKLKNSLVKEITMGVLAGSYIALGFSLCMLVGGQLSKDLRTKEPGLFNFLFGIFGFPMGLTLCVLNGASLFTSNCAYMVCAYIEGKAPLTGVVRILLTSYFANLCGALMVMQLMTWGEVFDHREDFSVELSFKKTKYAFGPTFVKGILCNWLVCLAVWQGNAAMDVTGLAVGIFLPNSGFVSMGFEHSVANMYAIPLGIKLGNGMSISYFLLKNLIPVTLGNFVGSLFVSVAYGLVYGRWEKVISTKSEELYGRIWERIFPANKATMDREETKSFRSKPSLVNVMRRSLSLSASSSLGYSALGPKQDDHPHA